MPVYRSTGMVAELCTLDLSTASTSDQQDAFSRTALRHSLDNTESAVRCARALTERPICADDGLGIMHFLGTHQDMPFFVSVVNSGQICAGGKPGPVQEKQACTGIDSPLSSRKVTTTDVVPGDGLPDTLTAQNTGSRAAPSPQGVVLKIQLPENCFRDRYGTKLKFHDLKIEVFLNGQFAGAKVIMHKNRYRYLPLHFGGRRMGCVRERPWILVPVNSAVVGCAQTQQGMEHQWYQVSGTLDKEVTQRGVNKYGDIPCSAEFLQSLATCKLPSQLPRVSHSLAANRSSILDIVVTSGNGRQSSDKLGYLLQPQRPIDQRYSQVQMFQEKRTPLKPKRLESADPLESVSAQLSTTGDGSPVAKRRKTRADDYPVQSTLPSPAAGLPEHLATLAEAPEDSRVPVYANDQASPKQGTVPESPRSGNARLPEVAKIKQKFTTSACSLSGCGVRMPVKTQTGFISYGPLPTSSSRLSARPSLKIRIRLSNFKIGANDAAPQKIIADLASQDGLQQRPLDDPLDEAVSGSTAAHGQAATLSLAPTTPIRQTQVQQPDTTDLNSATDASISSNSIERSSFDSQTYTQRQNEDASSTFNPDLSQHCVLTYADPQRCRAEGWRAADAEAALGRQVPNERAGGMFREDSVLCGMRFVVG